MSKEVIPNLTTNIEYVQQLADLPNAVGGLTAGQLKYEFDHAGITIKDYINSVLVAVLNGVGANSTSPGAQYIGVKAFGGTPPTINVNNVQDALEELLTQAQAAQASTILDGTITTTKLADSAVTTAKINDGAVTGGKLDTGSVTDAKCDFSAGLTVDGELDVNDVIVLTSDMYVPTVGDLPANPKTGQLCFVKVS